MKVLLLLALIDANSGDVTKLWQPVPWFETRAACEKALRDAMRAPPIEPGELWGQCIAPELAQSDVKP